MNSVERKSDDIFVYLKSTRGIKENHFKDKKIPIGVISCLLRIQYARIIV